jgi:hypothetical protein
MIQSTGRGCEHWVWRDPAHPSRCGLPVKAVVAQTGLPPIDFADGRIEFEFCDVHGEMARKRGGEVLSG